MIQKLLLIRGSVVVIRLAMIQGDALLSDTPRFEVWAGEYLDDQELIDQRNQGGVPRAYEGYDETMQYNYATALAQHGESLGLPDAVPYLEQAVQQYEELLDSIENQYAQHNKQILEQLLQQNPKQDSQEQTSSDSQDQQSQGTSDENEGNEGDQGSQEANESGDSSQSGDEGSEGSQTQTGPGTSGLTDDQLQQLQDYQQELQQQQFQNQQYYGKQSDQSQSSSIFEQFFGRPQFEQGVGGEERDW